MVNLQGTVTLPGVGPVKKVYVLGGLALTAAILGFAYYRRSHAPADTTPAATDTTTPESDPGLGYTPTSPGGGSSNPYGYDAYGNVIPAPVPGSTGTGGVTSTNADWSAAAIAALEQTGMTEEMASAAITAVLGGLGVTSSQEAAFLRAAGVLGDPPQGYPKPIRVIASPAEPTPPPTTTPKPTPGQKAPVRPSGLKATGKGKTWVQLDWNPVKGADGYHVYRNGRLIVTVTYSQARMSGLRANTSYTFSVETVDNHKASPKTTINVRTIK